MMYIYLLREKEVQSFIKTPAYWEHKQLRFPPKDLAVPVSENQAFRLDDPAIRQKFNARYTASKSLYYNGQPALDDLLDYLSGFLPQL